MGEPGTKVVLTILVKCLDASTRPEPLTKGLLKFHPFQSAGDDQLVFGKLNVLQRYRENSIKFSLKVSEDKWDIFKRGAPFCEQAVIRPFIDEP